MQAITEWFRNIISLLSTFKIADLVDIIIIAILIYGILKLVRDTRAEQLLKGIFLVLLFYGLASIFSLTMVTSILKVFLDFSVIIIFIIFQPEIRKALEQLGRSKFTKSYLKIFQGGLMSNEERDDEIKAISDVADSAVVFSYTRTGALFVFERETKLTDIAATGTILNCDTSSAVFGNLFFNKAPLHDGACIIRGGKIFAAGCILPLNSKEDGRRDIGTRHRAAIGMSEVSDAIVVVVSEETGNISVAVNGVLTRDYDRDTLVNTLEEHLLPVDSGKPEGPAIFKKRKEKKADEE
ncbi:MAG: diadenylate cyclase CdaA [Ruminococcus sp.]|nr:diadenylate cyclase CdaA [Ruminococcus sp.]